MKIVVLDGYTTNPGDLSWDALASLGELTVYDRTEDDEIVARAGDAEIVISNKTPITRETALQLPKMRLCALMSTGYNVVDYVFLAEKGIPVCNIPAYSTDGVAQLVLAFLLEFAVGVGEHTRSVKDGEWASCADFCYWKKPIFELTGKTLGIIGMGKIGAAVAKRALAFGMRVIAYTPRDHGNAPDGVTMTTLETVQTQSDFLSLHCPLTPETKELVNSAFIAGMKDGAYLINTARGPVVNAQDVADALRSGKLAGAGFDVLENEPPAADDPIVASPGSFITPHIAWAAFETRARLMDILTENVRAFLAGAPKNVVNL